MKKLNLTFAILLFYFVLHAQSFEFTATNPFDIQISSLDNTSKTGYNYKFFDSDQDGDLDLYISGIDFIDSTSASIQYNLSYFIAYQENIGSKSEPQFATRENINTFQYPVGESFMLPTLGDLNNDGLVDFVVSSEVDLYDIQYLRFHIQNNDGTFTVTNCLDWDLPTFNPYSFFVPELLDLDLDGDLDLLLGGYYSIPNSDNEYIESNTYLYAKNIGTVNSPEFLGWFHNPYGLSPDEKGFFASGDIDNDGDVDLINLQLLEDLSLINFVENIGGEVNRPEFSTPDGNVFGLPQPAGEDESFLFPSLVDLDGDGDLDLFLPTIMEDSFELRYYENSECFPQSAWLELIGINMTAINVPGNTYTWIDCDSEEVLKSGDEPTFTPSTSGMFKVFIKDVNGCTSESECVSVIISNTQDNAVQNKLDVYPNPTDGIVYLTNKSQEQVKSIEVFNSKGQLIKNYNSMSSNKIDFSSNDVGLYLIKIKLERRDVIKKVILINK